MADQFKAEYAKSGRASCKGCTANIKQNTLRLAKMVQSPHFDGKIPNWFHFACFFKRIRIGSETQLTGFHTLRWNDQQKVKERIHGTGFPMPSPTKSPSKMYNNFKQSTVSSPKKPSNKVYYSRDFQFLTEYAKSSRSTCKGCYGKIEMDSLRMAEMVPSQSFDGVIPSWSHFQCFPFTYKIKHFNEISGFELLRWDDQQKIKQKLGLPCSPYKSPTSSPVKASSFGQSPVKIPSYKGVVDLTENLEFQTENAKSGRSSCRICQTLITRHAIRISKLLDAGARSSGKSPHWYHLDCFAEHKMELGAAGLSASSISGYDKLNPDDQELMKSYLNSSESKPDFVIVPGSATGIDVIDSQPMTGNDEEYNLMQQSEELWRIRDSLHRECKTSDLKEMLDVNQLNSGGGESDLLDRCSDGMMFGALCRCPECGYRYLIYNATGYSCKGQATAWTRCLYTTKNPKRRKWIIPSCLMGIDFLKNFRFNFQSRIFPKIVAEAATSSSSSDLPLADRVILYHGNLTLDKAEFTAKVKALGGAVVVTPSSRVLLCVSTIDDVSKYTAKIKKMHSFNIPVVTEEYLDAVVNGNVALLINQYIISSWGSDRDVPDGLTKIVNKRALSYKPTAAMAKKAKLTMKGGAVVDPDSGLEGLAHVLQKTGNVYTAVLGMVDVTRGTNSYYKIQLLEYDSMKRYKLFRAWGRVGTTIGSNKTEDFHLIEDAIDAFTTLYAEKTGSSWEGRKFAQKIPGRFYPLDIDYGHEDDNISISKLGFSSDSKLAKPVQDIIKMIFDVESMKKAMVEFEIDLNKMPLGKLSKRQLDNAYGVLGELQKSLLAKGTTSSATILDCSNRFYTLIPHDFGLRSPPPLNSLAMIKSKTRMIDNLMEIEIAYSLLKKNKDDKSKDPIDQHYESLRANMEVLSHSTKEFAQIKEYVRNTHGLTHDQYSLEVVDVFKIERHGEQQRYDPFKRLQNRRLLWHGSRVTNFAGILSQGLRIAPPDAPVSGYMFGKGVYFADMVSKSANYCYTTPSDTTGLMLLCEVALGNMYELKNAKSITRLPAGKQSCKGCGSTGPNPNGDVVLDGGVIMPCGKAITSGSRNTSLLYNEYIVYDVSQIRMKYLLKLKFNYRY